MQSHRSLFRFFDFQSLIPFSITFGLVAANIILGSCIDRRAEAQEGSSYALKDLDGHFPFAVPESKEAWEERAQELRSQIEVSLGLFPRPSMAPLQPVIHSTRLMDGYSVAKVYFESLPGLYVTGNLYAPLEKESEKGIRRPAVLCPHGHWQNGRFYFTSDTEARRELANGAERFEAAAHSPLQARCVQMARMGIIVFHYDMIGYADSQQISLQRAHGFGQHGPNPDVGPDRWLLFSPKAEGLLQNVMGIQTINTIQSLEFLLQRSDVDPQRISITGASGGGTQTFLASAIEPRFAGAYPVVMVSTSMQGGCTCENASGLRVDTGNVEIAALTAPRPQGMNAADDWTRNMARDGFPELKKLYGLYGSQDQVNLQVATHFPHNYNHVTRVAMYGFMNRLFGLGQAEPILESDFEVLRGEDLSVWNEQHPAPKSGVEFEADLLHRWEEDIVAKVAASEEIRRQGWKTILQPAERIASKLKVREVNDPQATGGKRWSVQNADGTMVGSITRSKKATGPIRNIQILDGSRSMPDTINDSILTVDDAWGIDMKTSVQSLVKNPRPAACYTYGYNPPLFLRRLAVLLAVLDSQASWIPESEWVASDAEASLVAAAAVMRPGKMANVSVDAGAFDFDRVETIRDAYFLPGSVRFGGVRGLQSLHSNRKE
ncbi:MAG: acetylxylan esterase [Pirellula sp.]|nr:acetylxylan esterase [Pirellula sp.]